MKSQASLSLMALSQDGQLLFVTRIARLFAYGFLSIVLVLYLVEAGLTEAQIGALLTLTLIGDVVISLWITTTADRIGRRRMLIVSAILMVFAGTVFALTRNIVLLVVAAIIGVISPSGNEIGPFLPIEQSALSQIVSNEKRTGIFAWYNLMGSFATALGALGGGALAEALRHLGMSSFESYRTIMMGYAGMGAVLALVFRQLSPAVEAFPKYKKLDGETPESLMEKGSEKVSSLTIGGLSIVQHHFGLFRSGPVVLKLAALFSLDAFAGGFVLQSIVAYWFHVRFGVELAILGGIFFGANILAGLSALTATWLASRIGLINTMVFTHIPSNIFLILVPLMPDLPLAITVLLLRFSISQMDVPTRQSYTMAVVNPEERSAAGGLIGIVRSVGAALSPVLAAPLMGNAALLSLPFFLAGGLKIIYDLLLYRSFCGNLGRTRSKCLTTP